MFKHIIFDLDGTLTDSKPGIVHSIQYSLARVGITEEDEKKLESFVGPPLMSTYKEVYGLSDEERVTAYAAFQEVFTSTGMFDNKVYDGIPALLKELKEKGCHLYIGTSKPEVHALTILRHFGLYEYFTLIRGAKLGDENESKAQTIGKVLEQIPQEERVHTVMVGDRKYDIEGGRSHGLSTIALGYGYGQEEELVAAKPMYMAYTVSDLRNILLVDKKNRTF